MPSHLKIQLQKKRDLAILRCERPDGSITFSRMQHAMAFHDLAHYAVEMELGFSQAFYGLLAEGYAIEDFELPRDKRPEALIPANLPEESLQTEHLVNLLQVHAIQDSTTDIRKQLAEILAENELSYPKNLSPERLASIQERLQELLENWKRLQVGQSLELSFPLD
ncbi:hypothetical protein [Robiginitalea myxolifaciens]|nr:hypothetical protein [Robiginitalea myxolifaciens]